MPFPLLRVPYGLRGRLIELCSPPEGYSFQIAAPEFPGLLPIQNFTQIRDLGMCTHCDKVGKIVFVPNSIFSPLKDGVKYIVDTLLYIQQYSDEFPDLAQMDRFHLNTPQIRFQDCDLTVGLMQKLSTHLQRHLTSIHFDNCDFSPENDDWLEVVSALKYKQLESLYFVNAPQEVLEVDKDALYTFVKAQREQFQLDIHFEEEYLCEMPIVQILIKRLLGQYFVRRKNNQLRSGPVVALRLPNKDRFYILRENAVTLAPICLRKRLRTEKNSSSEHHSKSKK